MADISTYLQAIMSAVYGEEVRGSIHDAIALINDVGEVVLSTGTAVNSASSSSTGYYTDSLYFNTNTKELWKCIGTDSWQSQGTLKGDQGDPGDDGVGITSIEKTATAGLVDTYTITYTDGDTSTFTVTNGQDGSDGRGITSITKTATVGLIDTYTITYTDGTTSTFDVQNGLVGNKWYTGIIIEGKSSTPTVFSGSGITYAYVGDMYLNISEGAVYHCTLEGDPTVATWVYDFTITGSGSGATVMSDLQDVDITSIVDGQLLQYDSNSSEWKNVTLIDTIVQNSTKAAQSGAVYTALAGKEDTLTFDPAPTNGSGNPVTSGGVYTALSGKQDTLTFDNVPTQNSDNPVKSGGVYSSLADKADKTDLASIQATGATNATGSVIKEGTYFYLNGVLVRAKADIATGATFTSGTNYETVTAGALNTLAPRYRVLATAEADKTFAQQLDILKPAYEALTDDERGLCRIRWGTNGALFVNYSIQYGIFARLNLPSGGVPICYLLRLSDSTFYSGTTASVNDVSTTTDTNAMYLEILTT